MARLLHDGNVQCTAMMSSLWPYNSTPGCSTSHSVCPDLQNKQLKRDNWPFWTLCAGMSSAEQTRAKWIILDQSDSRLLSSNIEGCGGLVRVRDALAL